MWNMNDIVEINYQDGYTFHVAFDNGVAGSIDLSEYTAVPIYMEVGLHCNF